MKEIYSFLVSEAVLSGPHQDNLQAKRGFSKELIEELKFRSGGPYLLEIEPKLIVKFMERDLVASGVFIQDGRRIRMNPQLLREETELEGKKFDNILIPYLDEEGAPYLIRPHKMGFKGVGAQVYQTLFFKDKSSDIVLTEGEFKAAAGWQYAIPTIAIPGVGSFSEKKFSEFAKMLTDKKIKRVTILFDNETKDDPEIAERYNPKPEKRHDTEFYAYYMASRLELEAGLEVLIATLPNAWKVRGKIDIDGALAQGHASSEIARILSDALPRDEYLRNLDEEARVVVLRKSSQKRHRSDLRRDFNRYVVTRRKGTLKWDQIISNFVIRIIAVHSTSEGIRRVIQFINEFGQVSSTCAITPEEMSGADSFRTFCFDHGGFVWRGSTEDLLTIWESEFLHMDDSKHIVEADHLGWFEEEKVWLFGNVVYTPEGKKIEPDEAGIFWLDKNKGGIKPIPLSVTGGRGTIYDGIPHLSKVKIDMGEVLIKLSDAIGRNEARILLGWVSAVPFMEEVFRAAGCFPFLFVTGRWQSGKSTICEWAMNFFGIENAGKSISHTTPVAIQRSLAYYSSLPIWLDEYRNTHDIKAKDGFLRNVYNRQSAGKGTREGWGLRDAKVRGTLIISGEETPKDGGLLSRCVNIFISKEKRTQNHYKWITAQKMNFSWHIADIIQRKQQLTPRFLESFDEWREHFLKEGISSDRVAVNYAAVVAGYEVAFGTSDLEFANSIVEDTKSVQEEYGEEQAIAVFIDDLMALKTRGLIDARYWDIAPDETGKSRIWLYFHGLHQIWSQEFKKSQGVEAFKEGSIRAYLKEEKGFVAMHKYKRIRGENKRCVVFDRDLASDEIKFLVEGSDGK